MTLEKHMIDTMKEWQLKMGKLDFDIRLYYPRESLCDYLKVEEGISNDQLMIKVQQYLKEQATFMGAIDVSFNKDRFCFTVGETGCTYVENEVETSRFLAGFLKVLSVQKMEPIQEYFETFAKDNHTSSVCVKESDGLGTVLYIEDETVEPYVYCVEQDEFGITYHRFAQSDYHRL